MSLNLKNIGQLLTDMCYSLKLPSTGEEVYFKPYTLKDEFRLAQANSSDSSNMLFVMNEIICEKFYNMTQEQISSLTLIDIQMMLIHLKIFSDKSLIDVILHCSEDEYEFKQTLDLKKISIKNIENLSKDVIIKSNKLKYDLILTFTPISFSNYINKNVDIDSLSEKEIIMRAISKITYGEETISISEINKTDLSFFIDCIPSTEYANINNFFTNQPELVYDDLLICPNCKHKNIVGLSDFFYLVF
jgi:hypothetical protein